VINPSNERHEIIADLNARIARDERVESVLLGLSDGVTIARKRT
jgi:caffeoyl-CoA O-methyltransferase